MSATAADVERLRKVALDASTELASILRVGGEPFGRAWMRLLDGALGATAKPAGPAFAQLVAALEAVWRQPPDAFPDEASAVAWAMRIRPGIREVLDAGPAIVPEAPLPEGVRLTRNGRKIIDALDGHATLRRGEIALRAGLWRGSANRALDRLRRDGLVIEGADGVRRA